jgi:transcriptional regulator with XRE-family HTH domain
MTKEVTLGERLQSVMDMRELTQGQVALKTGVEQSHISLILAGKRNPRIDKVIALARGLDVSLDWLCDLPRRESNPETPDEKELLDAYRQIQNPDIKRMILNSAKDGVKIEGKS